MTLSTLSTTSGLCHTAFPLGVIEGFYGRPWPHALRLAYAEWLRPLGLDAYLYAPKSDPWLRRCWRQDWDRADWHRMQALAARYARCGAELGIGLSPMGLQSNPEAQGMRLLRAKIRRINELEVPLLAILFDDMPGGQSDLAQRQLDIVHAALLVTNAKRVLVCPSYYTVDPVLERVFGPRPDGYWEALGAGLPPQVGVFWTGNRVCAEGICAQDLETISDLLCRPVTLWDNYPVNDGAQRSEHLFLEPAPDRDPALREAAAGHFCNAMNQPMLSLPALAALGQSYGRAAADQAWLESVLGKNTWAALRADAAEFGTARRSALPPARLAALLHRYQALAAHKGESAAALEVVDWLSGGYAFDPACLTD